MSRHPFGDGSPARELSCLLADRVEAVCRYYLSNGVRSGCYWIVGDTGNTKGRSLFVRLTGPVQDKGARGKWRDAATGEHGDLLDLIAARERHRSLAESLAEARRFLNLPLATNENAQQDVSAPFNPDTARFATRIWTECQPIVRTLGEVYFRERDLCLPAEANPLPLRFHPALHVPRDARGSITQLPGIVAAVTDLEGCLTGIHRTWLRPDGLDKAAFPSPRRSLGAIHGHGVWLRLPKGQPRRSASILLVGEGIETVQSYALVLRDVPLVAALSASHLGGFILPPGLKHLLIVRDNDAAGRRATRCLADRGQEIGATATIIRPVLGDFNADLRQLGVEAVRRVVRDQLPQSLLSLC